VRSVIEAERQRTGQSGPADPRRRLGRHAEARRFLSEDGGPVSAKPGVWDGLLTALHRHTIHATLASLAASQRQVLHMAYLEGRTNREIAAILSISRSTVRRRIVLALANLDSQIRQVGTRASAVLLLLLAFAAARAQAVGRPISALRATPAGNVILATAAGATAGAVVFAAIVSNQGAPVGGHGPTQSVTQVTAGAPLVILAPPVSTTGGGSPSALPHGNTPGTGSATGTSVNANASLHRGCGGNPTNAPPDTPVGPRTAPGQGASPVTHPGAGGCGPHAGERS
jgi:sigma-70-like protein